MYITLSFPAVGTSLAPKEEQGNSRCADFFHENNDALSTVFSVMKNWLTAFKETFN